ncbi:beta-ketoacyl synthase chain length factor [Chitinophaga japonensis]|uniref:3-oxoacyl-(Acyl-carrier-protein) synthase n=1 Tax=Chitinophaga japonensis TaxID=104662 RepID=A0A562T4R9_CHIJA|nr:beta-ketoacyl synthase chain length factor [Chitinophaga japonensis]TWI88363.1 3-oxoacyl-(acyl-carrier-protein) synthase [Chitinophaga japonensis]
MNIYIQGTGCVSPQDTTVVEPFLAGIREYEGDRLKAVEPDYRQWIDLKLIRRMGRVVKMGIAAAKLSLQEAGIDMPDAIVTGTAYGCLEDTGIFLSRMVAQQEEMLTPTAFIQSTHNTVGGQIALLLGCHAYNNTFVHRAFSFESALLDSMMLLQEQAARQVLVGGVDEITDHSHRILSRFGLYKQAPVRNTALLQSHTGGTIGGEGAAYFMLGTERNVRTVARITGLATIYKPADEQEMDAAVEAFLAAHHCSSGDIDLLISGRNGHAGENRHFTRLEQKLFQGCAVAGFKHLCGEYPTASAFATWLGARILHGQQLPQGLLFSGAAPRQLDRILIYNCYQGTHHSLILLDRT